MRTINTDKLNKEFLELIFEKHPIDEDIGILDENGELLGVLIPPRAYEFFLEKVEEEEDRIDQETVAEFNRSGEKNNEQ